MRARRAVLVPVVLGLLLGLPLTATARKVGDKVWNTSLRDANDKPAKIPDLGKKVITLFYTDPDVKDLNEPFRDYLKAAKLDKSKYRGMGVANLKDTWKPNWIIRKVIRGKIKKFNSLILTDPNHTLKKSWSLGKCDGKDIAIVIGKDKRVHFIKKTALTAAERKATLKLIKELMEK